MAQSFHFITPVSCNADLTAGSYSDVDLDDYTTPTGTVTGVLLQIYNSNFFASQSWFARKNGSTDDRYYALRGSAQCFYACGVDASNIFEIKAQSTTDINVYIIGYTTTGVAFDTNGVDVSLSTTATWTDLSALPANSIGGIYNIYSSRLYQFGFRKNGSTDDRTFDASTNSSPLAIIGCDASQVVEGYIENTAVDFYRIGYITDGATFHTNATDRSLGTTGSYQDITLTTDAIGGFIEVTASGPYSYALRKNGTSYDYYYDAYIHPWAIVECDASYKIEGKIENTAVDFWEVGYAEAGGTDYSISITASLSISSTIDRDVDWDRTITPDLSISTNIIRNVDYNRNTTSLLSVAADVLKSYGRTITTNTNLIISSTISIFKGFSKTITTGLTNSVSVSRSVEYNRSSNSILSISASVAKQVAWNKAISVSLSISSAFSAIKNKFVQLLNLITRTTSLTLKERNTTLTLKERSTSLTLRSE